jgi:hypothetical protein
VIRLGDSRSGADVSADGAYRYVLWRRWSGADVMVWVMLNPSTADHEVDDQTIRKCVGFAKREGCGGIEVVNLYAYRSRDPMVLCDVEDPEGPDNRRTWEALLARYWRGPVVAAWGGSFPRCLAPSRAYKAADPSAWLCLGHTTEGHPRHPSRIAYSTPLVPMRRAAA